MVETIWAPDGGSEVQVSGQEVGSGLLTDFAWMSNSSRLAYRVKTGDLVNFYLVGADGTGRVQVPAGGG